jgi:hypothetical protein
MNDMQKIIILAVLFPNVWEINIKELLKSQCMDSLFKFLEIFFILKYFEKN